VLLLRFPFSDATGSRQRPALVIFDAGDEDVLVARITRQERTDPQDVEIKEWSSAGLLVPSTVRLHKLATVEKSLVSRKLGRLSDTDRKNVRDVLQEVFGSF